MKIIFIYTITYNFLRKEEKMRVQEYTATRTLFTYKDLTLSSYIRLPKVTLKNKNLNINGCYVSLYLRINKIKREMNPSYQITLDNCYDIVNWINDGLLLFYGDKYPDLFYRGDNDELIFNIEYKDLHVDTYREKATDPVMRLYPNLIRTDEWKRPEMGMILMINRIENSYKVPLSSMRKLLNILNKFSFQEETNLALNSIIFNQLNNSIEKEPDTINGVEYNREQKNGIWEKKGNDKNDSMWTK